MTSPTSCGLVARLGEFAFVESPARCGRRIGPGVLGAKTRRATDSPLDQFGRRSRDDEVVKCFPSPFVQGVADSPMNGTFAHAGPSIHLKTDLWAIMRFVDDDERGVWFLAPGERLDCADLNGLCAIRALVDALYDADAVNALALEGGDGLVDQRQRRHGEDDALALVERAPDDVGGEQGLAEAGRGHKHRSPLAGRQRLPQSLQRSLLVRSERAQSAGRCEYVVHVALAISRGSALNSLMV